MPFSRLSRPQMVTVRYRGTLLATWHPTEPGWRVFTAGIPADLPSGSIDEIRFGFDERARPADLGLSADTRPLAAYVRRVRFDVR